MLCADVFRIIFEFSDIESRCTLMTMSRATRRVATDPKNWHYKYLIMCVRRGLERPFRAMIFNPQHSKLCLHEAVAQNNTKLIHVLINRVGVCGMYSLVEAAVFNNSPDAFAALHTRVSWLRDVSITHLIKYAVDKRYDDVVVEMIKHRSDAADHMRYMLEKYMECCNWRMIKLILHSPMRAADSHADMLIYAMFACRKHHAAEVRAELAALINKGLPNVDAVCLHILDDPDTFLDIIDVLLVNQRIFARTSIAVRLKIAAVAAVRMRIGVLHLLIKRAVRN